MLYAAFLSFVSHNCVSASRILLLSIPKAFVQFLSQVPIKYDTSQLLLILIHEFVAISSYFETLNKSSFLMFASYLGTVSLCFRHSFDSFTHGFFFSALAYKKLRGLNCHLKIAVVYSCS